MTYLIVLLICIIILLIVYTVYEKIKVNNLSNNLPKNLPESLESYLKIQNAKNDKIFKSYDKRFEKYDLFMTQNSSNLKADFANFQISIDKNLKVFNDLYIKTQTEITELKNQLRALQDYITQKEKIIDRFTNGYDYKIQQKFIFDIINLIDFIYKKDEYKDILDDILIMLENNSILIIEPKKGEKFDGKENIYKVVSIKNSENKDEVGTVESVEKLGFYLQISDETIKVLRPASIVLNKAKD